MDEIKTRTDGYMSRRVFLTATGMSLAGFPLADSTYAQAESHCLIRFGIVTDCHYADREAAGSRYYRDSLDKVKACVQRMNDEKVDFLIELGDFKDQDTLPVEEKTLSYLRVIEEAFSLFQGPRFHVLGNHDMDSLSKTQFLTQVKNTDIPVEQSFFSFDIKGLHGVVLDANYRSDGQDYDHGDFDWTDSNIPQAQLDWLKQDLSAAQVPGVVFVHQRLDGEGNLFVKNAEEVRKVLEQSGKVSIVFQGHDHEGGYNLINDIHYYTLKAAVEGPGLENNAYAVVEMDSTRTVILTGYGQALSKHFEPAR